VLDGTGEKEGSKHNGEARSEKCLVASESEASGISPTPKADRKHRAGRGYGFSDLAPSILHCNWF
jgi:hypothetical protein